MLKPTLKKTWDAACVALDEPSPESFDAFRRTCRPVDIMSLLRAVAENHRPDRSVPFRVY